MCLISSATQKALSTFGKFHINTFNTWIFDYANEDVNTDLNVKSLCILRISFMEVVLGIEPTTFKT